MTLRPFQLPGSQAKPYSATRRTIALLYRFLASNALVFSYRRVHQSTSAICTKVHSTCELTSTITSSLEVIAGHKYSKVEVRASSVPLVSKEQYSFKSIVRYSVFLTFRVRTSPCGCTELAARPALLPSPRRSSVMAFMQTTKRIGESVDLSRSSLEQSIAPTL